jgi:ABC-2 type transport system ATP-binding protein
VDRLALEVRRGECFGLLGPNGAGKTTTLEVLEGLRRPRSGEVEVLGARWGRGEAADRALRERLGVALQETRLPEKLTVLEILRLFRSFYRRGRDVEELIAALGLGEKRRARVGRLSGGQRQRLAVACALVGSPDLLFLDEPTTGLDPLARREIWDLVGGLVRGGATILLTTHSMEEAERLCGRVAIMDRGRVVALDSPPALIRGLEADTIVELEVEGPLPGDAAAGAAVVRRVERRAGRWALHVRGGTAAVPDVLAHFRARGIAVKALSARDATLDDVFLHLTGRALADG